MSTKGSGGRLTVPAGLQQETVHSIPSKSTYSGPARVRSFLFLSISSNVACNVIHKYTQARQHERELEFECHEKRITKKSAHSQMTLSSR